MCHIQAETHSWILTTYGVEKKTCFKATDLKENLGQVFKEGPKNFIQVGFSEFLQSWKWDRVVFLLKKKVIICSVVVKGYSLQKEMY